jgi:hypothetical protein
MNSQILSRRYVIIMLRRAVAQATRGTEELMTFILIAEYFILPPPNPLHDPFPVCIC